MRYRTALLSALLVATTGACTVTSPTDAPTDVESRAVLDSVTSATQTDTANRGGGPTLGGT